MSTFKILVVSVQDRTQGVASYIQIHPCFTECHHPSSKKEISSVFVENEGFTTSSISYGLRLIILTRLFEVARKLNEYDADATIIWKSILPPSYSKNPTEPQNTKEGDYEMIDAKAFFKNHGLLVEYDNLNAYSD